MSPGAALGLVAFAFVSSVTPGPNNLMLMSSGARFGLRPTVPHMLGVTLGFAWMTLAVGAGLAQAVLAVPALGRAVEVASVAYLLVLAGRVAVAGAVGGAPGTGRPMGFWAAAGFQWVNPKAWAMALTAVGAYAPSRTPAGTAFVAAAFAVTTFPSVTIWTLFGRSIRGALSRPARRRAFNVTMALLLLASLLPVVLR